MTKISLLKSWMPLVVSTIVLLIAPAAGRAVIVDFEDLPEAGSPLTAGDPGSQWHGDDLFENNPPEYTHTATESSFISNGIEFENLQDHYMTEWGGYEFEVDYWDGWAYSNRRDIDSIGRPGEFTAMGSGVEGENGASDSAQYAVVSVAASKSTLLFDTDRSLESACFTNNAYAYSSMLNGDGFAKKFGGETGDDPDWFLLTITGKDTAGQTTGTAEVYLADFQFENNEEDYILDSWTQVDLSVLGDNLRSVEFALSSSDSGTFGMNTPAYFAIDNIVFTSIPGDANNDGRVDVSDLGILATNFGAGGTLWTDGDFNQDGTVDVIDLGILATAYGSGSAVASSQAVPEPSWLCAAGALCAFALWSRKRR